MMRMTRRHAALGIRQDTDIAVRCKLRTLFATIKRYPPRAIVCRSQMCAAAQQPRNPNGSVERGTCIGPSPA
ncbi:hypothetical protein [Burkholderia stabilis]|uniref:hypothetical protein n=1 Tax=Burkholderia stabilis TaxID=95485 RepID=UPI0012FD2C54|nr:hypothetical protein [Burkholderia stabilis]